jgi:hypothetical protein
MYSEESVPEGALIVMYRKETYFLYGNQHERGSIFCSWRNTPLDITVAPPLDPMTNLRIVLNTYVPDDDLALLAAGLGIPMPGATKRDRVRALIITADHAGRLDALVQRLQAMHPDLPLLERVRLNV